MAQSNAQAWWAEVEDIRESIEARRATEDPRSRSSQPAVRRTISITGRPAEHARPLALVADTEDPPATLAQSRRRPPRRVSERLGTRPDRIAAWAVLLGFVLVLGTILTAHS
jgi:hypothetical protein